MRRLVPLLLAVLPLVFAPAPFLPKKMNDAEAELKALQGDWARHEYNYGLQALGGMDGSCTFTGRTYIARQSGKVISEWSVTLDTSKTPGVMRLRRERPDDNRVKAAAVLSCRYRLDGETLTMSWDERGDSLPDDLRPRTGFAVEIMKRKRP
jgi:uncharacterized protein (TIGR03067 family)